MKSRKIEIEFYSHRHGSSTLFIEGESSMRVSTFQISQVLQSISKKLFNEYADGNVSFFVTKNQLEKIKKMELKNENFYKKGMD